MLIASHNLMHARHLDELLALYARLQAERPVSVLCLQENHSDVAETVAGSLGPSYAAVAEPDATGVALVYDRDQLSCSDHELVPLPRLERLSWLERRYIAGGKTKQKYALCARLEHADGSSLVCTSFHLDTAGGNAHRKRQMRAIADSVRDCQRLVVCGDTNAFAWPRRRQRRELREMLAPLEALGASDPESQPTHYFARQREPLLTHRIVTALGRVGLDIPLRYDVVCTNVAVRRRGQEHAEGSDHDLVWAELDLGV